MEAGLSETAAMKALTITPAQLLKADDLVGSLKKGMLANFIITSGKLFDEKTTIYQNWVQGQPYELKSLDTKDFSGNYNLSIDGKTYQLEVSGEAGNHKSRIRVNDTTTMDVSGTFGNDLITLKFQTRKEKYGQHSPFWLE